MLVGELVTVFEALLVGKVTGGRNDHMSVMAFHMKICVISVHDGFRWHEQCMGNQDWKSIASTPRQR